MADVLGNHISMTFTTLLTAGAQIKSGAVVGLAVTSVQRHPAYPEIPTFGEQGFPQVRGDTWFWLTGPKNMPPAIVEVSTCASAERRWSSSAAITAFRVAARSSHSSNR